MQSLAKLHGLVVTSTTGGQHAPNSYHYSGHAIDVSGDPAKMAQFAKDVQLLYGSNPELKELYHTPVAMLKNGQAIQGSTALRNQHVNHVHVAWGAPSPAVPAPAPALPPANTGSYSSGADGPPTAQRPTAAPTPAPARTPAPKKPAPYVPEPGESPIITGINKGVQAIGGIIQPGIEAVGHLLFPTTSVTDQKAQQMANAATAKADAASKLLPQPGSPQWKKALPQLDQAGQVFGKFFPHDQSPSAQEVQQIANSPAFQQARQALPLQTRLYLDQFVARQKALNGANPDVNQMTGLEGGYVADRALQAAIGGAQNLAGAAVAAKLGTGAAGLAGRAAVNAAKGATGFGLFSGAQKVAEGKPGEAIPAAIKGAAAGALGGGAAGAFFPEVATTAPLLNRAASGISKGAVEFGTATPAQSFLEGERDPRKLAQEAAGAALTGGLLHGGEFFPEAVTKGADAAVKRIPNPVTEGLSLRGAPEASNVSVGDVLAQQDTAQRRAQQAVPKPEAAAPAPATGPQVGDTVRLKGAPELGYLRVEDVKNGKVRLTSVRDGKPVIARADALEVQQAPDGFQFQAPQPKAARNVDQIDTSAGNSDVPPPPSTQPAGGDFLTQAENDARARLAARQGQPVAEPATIPVESNTDATPAPPTTEPAAGPRGTAGREPAARSGRGAARPAAVDDAGAGGVRAESTRPAAFTVTQSGGIKIEGKKPLTFDEISDLAEIHAAAQQARDQQNSAPLRDLHREWGDERMDRATHTGAALTRAGILEDAIKAHRDWLAEQEAKAQRQMERSAQKDLESRAEAGRPLLDEAASQSVISTYQDPRTGKTHRYYDLSTGPELSPDKLEQIYKMVRTDARERRKYPTNGGDYELSELVREEKKLPLEFVKDTWSDAGRKRAQAEREGRQAARENAQKERENAQAVRDARAAKKAEAVAPTEPLTREQTVAIVKKSMVPDFDRNVRETANVFRHLVERGEKISPAELAERVRKNYDLSNPRNHVAYSVLMHADPEMRFATTIEGHYVHSRHKGNERKVEVTREEAGTVTPREPVAVVETPKPTEPALYDKQPWEMTRDEWNRHWEDTRPNAQGTGGDSKYGGMGRSTGKKGLEQRVKSIHARQEFLKMGLHDSRPYPDMPDYVVTPRHRQVVEQALAEGKKVPAHVLADYPDLQPKPAPKPAEQPQSKRTVESKASEPAKEKPSPPPAVETKTAAEAAPEKSGAVAAKDEPATLSEQAAPHLDAIEQAARDRIKNRGGRLSSGIDPEALADYAVIGAVKIARQVVKTGDKALDLADWAKEMIADFGDAIRPHLGDLWDAAKQRYDAEFAPKRSEWDPAYKAEEAPKNTEATPKAAKPIEKKTIDTSSSIDRPSIDAEKPAATGLANQVQEREVLAGIIDDPEKGIPQSAESIQAQGKAILDAKADPIGHAEELARRIASKKQGISSEAFGILLDGKRRLLDEINARRAALDHAVKSNDPEVAKHLDAYEQAQERLQSFLNDVQKGKTEWHNIGMALQAGATVDEGNFAEVLAEAKRRRNGKIDPKTEKQLRDLTTQVKELQEKVKAQEEKEAAQAREEFRGQADQVVKRASTRTPRYDRDAILKEREQLKTELKQRLNKLAGSLGSGPERIAYDGVQMLHTGGKLLLNYAKEGINSLDEALAKTRADLHEAGIDATDDQIIDDVVALGRKEQRAKSEVQQNLAEVKRLARRDAQLRGEIEALRDGQAHETPQQRKVSTARINRLEAERDALLKPILDARRTKASAERLQDQIDTLEQGGKLPQGKKPAANPALEPLRERRDELQRQRAVQDQIAELERQLREKDYLGLPQRPKRDPSNELKALRQQRDLLAGQVRQAIRGVTTGEKAEAWFKSALLSNPLIPVRKGITDALQVGVQVPERVVRGVVDAGVAKLQGREREFHPSEAGALVKGYAKGSKEGAAAAGHVMRHGMSAEQLAALDSRYEPPGGLKNPLNWVTRATGAVNEAAWHVSFQGELAAQAQRAAAKAGDSSLAAKLFADPTPEMQEAAKKVADLNTWKAPNDDLLARVNNLRNLTIPTTSIRPLQFVLPFVKTAYEMAKEGGKYTPAGLLDLAAKDAEGTRLYRTPQASTTISKFLVGAGTMAPLAMLAGAGLLTGAAPTERNERKRFYEKGLQPNSVKVGPYWVSYDHLGPLGTVMGMVANLHDAFVRHGDQPADKQVLRAAIAAGKAYTADRSYIESLAAIHDAMDDPSKAEAFVAGLVPIPGAVSLAENVTDGTRRAPDSIADRVKARIPGLAQQVPPMRDKAGNVIKRPSGVLALSPERMSLPTPNRNEVERQSPIGATGMPAPRRQVVERTLSSLGVKIPQLVPHFVPEPKQPEITLSGPAFQKYRDLVGNLIYSRVEEMQSRPTFRADTPENQRKALQGIVREAIHAARIRAWRAQDPAAFGDGKEGGGQYTRPTLPSEAPRR